MSTKYENLIKLYYKKQNIEDEYTKRIKNPTTFITNLKINPIKRGNKIFNKEYNLFYVNFIEHTLLQEIIIKNSNKINLISNELSQIVIKDIIIKILSNELYKTNKIEGIEIVKSEIHSSLKDNKKFNKKSNKLDGIIKKYKDIKEKNFKDIQHIDSLSSFRKIYDEMFEDFEKSGNYKLDGKYFRKDTVKVINGLGNTIHIGINGEEAIEKNIENLIQFMNRKDIPFLVKASITHFFFEYIHPFYDGNGRFGRYLLSLYLARKLDILTAFSLSYSISKNLDDYYKSFVEVEDVNNYGEITFFVENILKTIKSGQEMIIELLNDSVMRFNHSMEILNELTRNLSEKENILLQIYLQNYLFNDFEEITNVELSYIIGDLTQQTINKYTQELENKGYLVKIKQRPLTYTLSDKITDKL
ncbi:cell filamentation protein Fic [Fusobacterium nucleatum subsp. nucleatum]|uniref:Cell filamentation protein Fic n=1 Tax=Fusobacterium nucleatum subsp. nucleatum TaxID=76856 RepID=A0A101K501_FUSNC|nr:Fic family protein [Fusobacterium nucleatum]ALF23314.1 cell filamentation protein Fic [Fusobacterium nucleatum subsp. nucleatum ChDC F316]ASG25730.1 cell filamentation protein Fic [Fusobacterium nucleatum subsp. nucleatum]KUL97632.1 cell filamentation protein Fic [Fusobacterium nucleatum subsp. nucleatum]